MLESDDDDEQGRVSESDDEEAELSIQEVLKWPTIGSFTIGSEDFDPESLTPGDWCVRSL